jgi:hypothetical protein
LIVLDIFDPGMRLYTNIMSKKSSVKPLQKRKADAYGHPLYCWCSEAEKDAESRSRVKTRRSEEKTPGPPSAEKIRHPCNIA